MATLAAPIATDFNSLSLLAWLASAFFIGQGATQPLSGKLTDIFSRQWGLVISNCLFALGNAISGLAQSQWTMIVGRIIAGIGGGSLNTISAIIVSDLIPLRQRALWQGVGNTFWGLGNGLGGLFGGYMNDSGDWRMAFIAQIPLTIVSLIIIFFQFNTIKATVSRKTDSSKPPISRIDFLGILFLVSTLMLFLIGITAGGNIVPWSHPLACVPLPLAVVSFFAFIYVEQKVAREPVLPLHFLRDRTVLCACLTNWFFHMIFYIFIFYVPIYYRIRGVSTTKAGTALISVSVSLPLGSLIAGFITSQTGRYRYTLWATLVLQIIAAVGASFITLSSPLWFPMVLLGMFGLAIGSTLVVTLVAFTSAVEIKEQALVTSLSYVFRSTGSVLGVAIGSAVYQGVLDSSLWRKLKDLDDAGYIIRSIEDSLEEFRQLPEHLQDLARQSYMVALKASFSATVGLAVLAAVSGLLIRELKLHTSLARDDDSSNAKQNGQDVH